MRRLPLLLGTTLLLMACGGGTAVGDKASSVNRVLRLTPATVQVAPGQSLQMSAEGTWDGGLAWTVLPATMGSISSTGLFTAGSTPGPAQIVAVWSQDVRYTAAVAATVLPPAPPAESRPDLVMANGSQQTSATGGSRNMGVAGEAVKAAEATDVSGHSQVRHGFRPAGQ